MDVTASMGSWIVRAKEKLKEIIDNVIESNKEMKVRVSFVGYRDHRDDVMFELLEFTSDI